MSEIYSAPEADIIEPQGQGSEFNTLEKGIAGEYSLDNVRDEAWKLTEGAKGTFFIAYLLMFAIMIGVMVVLQIVLTPLTLLLGGVGEHTIHEGFAIIPIIMGLLTQLLLVCLTAPLSAGIFMLGVKRAANSEIVPTSIFNYFNKAVPLILVNLLVMIVTSIGYLFLVIPGIYLAICYIFAAILVVDKDLGPWEAMEASRKAVSHNWWKVFGTLFLAMIIAWVSMIPLGIGLIWTGPWFLILIGVMYRNIFGVEKATLGN